MIRIVLADDHRMLLETLGSLLELEEDLHVVGKASNGAEVLSLVKQFQPDICIMDIEMPLKSGLDVAEELQQHSCKIILLTTFARQDYLERVRKANVGGYLLKDRRSEDLIHSIPIILNGGQLYAPELIDMSYERELSQTTQDDKLSVMEKSEKATIHNSVSNLLYKWYDRNRITSFSPMKKKQWFK